MSAAWSEDEGIEFDLSGAEDADDEPPKYLGTVHSDAWRGPGGWVEDLHEWNDPAYFPEEAVPDLLLRKDGAMGLLYRNAANCLYGPVEQGKTWVGAAAAVEVLRDGGTVLWVDVDEMGSRLPKRLRLLGAPAGCFGDRLRIARPRGLEDVQALVDAPAFDLVVLDALSGLVPMVAATTVNAPSNIPDTVVRVMKATVHRWLSSGRTTVVLLDHTAKPGGLASGPHGAAAKAQFIRGSLIGIKAPVKEAPTPGRAGSFTLQLFKDTEGVLREDCRSRGAKSQGQLSDLGTFWLRPGGPGLLWEVLPPDAAPPPSGHDDGKREDERREQRERLAKVFADNGGAGGAWIASAVLKVALGVEKLDREFAGLLGTDGGAGGCIEYNGRRGPQSAYRWTR